MKEKILKLRGEGKTYNEIKKILNCSKGTISYHCSKLEDNDIKIVENSDIKNRSQIKEVSFLIPNKEIIESIISLRKIKKTYKEISSELKISINIISKVCRKLNLINKRNYGKLDNETISKIRLLYNELKSTRKVSKQTGVSRDSIMKYINIIYPIKLTEEELKKRRSNSVVDWRSKTKIKLVEYKGGKCEKCGYTNQQMHYHFIIGILRKKTFRLVVSLGHLKDLKMKLINVI